MNRLSRSFTLFSLCIAQFVLASNPSRAADKSLGEILLPKDTLAFFSIANVPEFKKKWEKSSMGQLVRDPQLKPFLDDVEKQIEEASKKMEGEVGVSVAELLALPRGEVMIAVMEKPAQKISVVVSLEYRDGKATMDKLLKKMDEALEKEAEHSTEEINRVTVHVYTAKNIDPQNPFKTVAYFTTDSHIVFGSEVDALKEVLERWDGKSDDTLAQNDQFKYILNQCKSENGEPLVKWYINPIGVIQSGIAVAQNAFPTAGVGMAGAFLPMFGVDELKGWGGAIDMDEGDFEVLATSYVIAENPRGLMGLFKFPATNLTPPKWIPADIGSYMVINWSVLDAYKSVETLVDSFQGRGATARFLDNYAEQGPMIHFKKDIIDNVDGKIHVLQAEPKEAEDAPPTPQVLVSLGLKDAGKMKKVLAASAKGGNSNLETREFNGETIYEVGSPAGDQVFSMVVSDGQLIFTNDTPLLEGVLRVESGRATLTESDEYKRVAKFYPSKTSMLSFQRSDAQLKTYYNMLKSADNLWDGVDVSKLPPFEAISKYLQPSGGYTVPDQKGAKSVTFSLKKN